MYRFLKLQLVITRLNLSSVSGVIRVAKNLRGCKVLDDNNANGYVKKTKFSNNANDNEGKYDKAKRVDFVADDLVRKFNLPETSREFMCKVAWKLPEARIWQHFEYVHLPPKPGKKPISNKVGMFIYLCKKDGV